MAKLSAMIVSVCLLAACSGNPFSEDEPATGGGGGAVDAPPIGGDSGLPPGTANPTPNSRIVRVEARDGAGNGYANGFSYDRESDTFFVQGLGFDGDQPTGVPYERVAGVSLPAGFAAYEGPSTVPDFLTGVPIGQLKHHAVFGTSGSGISRLAIVRTGSYETYGFGGYIYERNGGVVLPALPSQGQATYRGNYAGLRDSNTEAELFYVRGQAQVDIDFDGFSGNCTPSRCADAVRLVISDRRILDDDGNDISAEILPVLRSSIGTGVLNSNGEMTGDISSVRDDVSAVESGKFYAVMGGDHTTLEGGGGEIVGIVVVEGGAFRETGGFIVNRALQ